MKASAFSLLYDCFSSTNALIGLQNGAEKNSGQSQKEKKISLLTVPFRDIGEMVLGFDERDVVGGGCIFIDMKWKLKKKSEELKW